MQEKKTALIAGASGIVGRGIAERLVGDGWRVLCASRSGGGHLPGTEGVAVDLLDAEACARAVAPHAGITFRTRDFCAMSLMPHINDAHA